MRKSIFRIVLVFVLVLSLSSVSVKSDAASKVRTVNYNLTLKKGGKQSYYFNNLGGYSNISSVSVKSADKAIATVKKNGKKSMTITGKSKGSTKVTANIKLKKKYATSKNHKYVIKVKVTKASTVGAIDEVSVYQRMIAMKDKYPEGMKWDNSDSYTWNALGYPLVGYGCAGFAGILSDAAFGTGSDYPARKVNNPNASSVRVGDILRVNNDTHSVVVLEVKSNSFIIAEGNFNNSVHWGREILKSENIDYLYTRWPK